MKTKLFPVIILTAILTVLFFLIMWAMDSTVLAQGEPPAPYAGLKNPFPWDDTSVQQAGKQVFQTSCMGCHGANGRNLATADFGAADFPQKLEQRPDLYFWILSAGRLDKGMFPFKSSLSEQQRWQVLTYLWSLGKPAATPKETPLPTQPPEKTAARLVLKAPAQARSGQPLTLVASLKDGQGKPIENATVEFFIKVDFFASGLMKIAEMTTNSQGVATFKYSLRQTGDTQVVARYGTIETTATVSLTESIESFYQSEAGIRLPNVENRDVYIGPQPTYEPRQPTDAPKGAFRLPGGTPSWLLLIVATVMLIWVTYFRAIYQVLRIPIVKDITDTDTRLVPRVALAIVVTLGLLLVLVLMHGPYSHLHLLR